MKMKKRFLSILLGLVMVLGLMPWMSMTAYADISSVEIVTAGNSTTYKDTDENFTITCSAADGDGMKLGWGDINISAKDDDHTIRKVELTIGWYPQYAPNVVSDKGTITLPEDLDPNTGKGGIITIDGVNSKTLKLSHNNYNAPQLKKVKIYYGKSAHTHSFTYSASGATITATCGGTGTCDITEGLTLTISAPTGSLVYDGTTTYPATLSTGYNTTAFPDTYTISYTKDGSAYSGVPKDAGTYTASVTAGTGDGAKTASVGYTIAKAVPTITTAPTAGEITYGQTLANSNLTGGTASVSGDFAWKDPTVAPAVSDSQKTEYDVVFTPKDENYDKAECKVKLTVNKTAATVTKAPEAKALTYTGSAQELVTAGTASGGEMQYALGDANGATEPYTTSIPTGTEAGTYYVWYKAVGDDNHTDSAPACVTVTILKKPEPPKPDSLVYNGEAQALVTAGKVETGGTMVYALGTDAKTAPTDGWKEEVPTGVDAGTYYVWYKVKGDANHNDTEPASLEVEIAQKPLTITAKDQTIAEGESIKTGVDQVEASGLVQGHALTSIVLSAGSAANDANASATKTIAVSGAKIADAIGADVTANYAITYISGKLTVKEKPQPEPEPQPAQADYTLLARLTVASKTSMKLNWTKVPGADGYDVYFARCGKDFRKLDSVGASETCHYRIKGLDRRQCYKAYVQAWKKVNGKKVYIGQASPEVHAITGGYDAKYCNARSVKLNKSKLTLKAGKSYKLKATVKRVKSGKKLLRHVKSVRYYSSNTSVATVSGSGKVKAVGKGSCTIWAIAPNGVRASATVKVK